MDVKVFAERYHLRTCRDECSEIVILGRCGQIYAHGAGRFAVMVLAKAARYWNAARRRLVTAGCQITQNGDTEGTALFEPLNSQQAGLAINLIGAKQKRQLSEGQRAALVARLRTARKATAVPDYRSISAEAPEKGPFAALISTRTAELGG